MPAQIFGAQAEAVELYEAFFGNAPSNPIYNNFVATINASGDNSLALALGNQFAGMSDSALSAMVLANLGISAATTNAAAFAALSGALPQFFAANESSRGVVVLNLIKILTGLEGNATYGNAAVAFNDATFASFSFASDPAHNVPSNGINPPLNLVFTTGIDNLTGAAGNDTFTGSVDGGTGLLQTNGVTTYNAGDQVDGGAGSDTLKIFNAHNATLDINGSAATSVENLVVVNSDSAAGQGVPPFGASTNLEALNVNGGSFSTVTLDYGNGSGGFNNVNVDGVDAKSAFTVQNIGHWFDDTLTRNSTGAFDETAGTVATSNTIQNLNLSQTGFSGNDFFFEGNENFTNATTINHTLNVSNITDGNRDAGGYGANIDDNIVSNTDGSAINSVINISGLKILGNGDEGGIVDVTGSNGATGGGKSTYNVAVNIAGSDSVAFDYDAQNSGKTDTITYGLNTVANTTSNGNASEIFSSGFETINVNVTGASSFNYFGDDGEGNDMVVNINAAAAFTIAASKGNSNGETLIGSSSAGNVTLNITGAGDVALGQTFLGDGGATDKVIVAASTMTGKLSMDVQNDFSSITLGSGDDSIILEQALVAGHVINGGAGSDSLAFNNVPGVLIAEDYALINGVALNFEKLEFKAGLTLDASKLTGTYTSFTFDQSSTVTKVAAGEALVAKASLTATAAGYTAAVAGVAPVAAVPAGPPDPVTGVPTPAGSPGSAGSPAVAAVYAGALDITAKGDGSTIIARADSATVTVKAGTGDVHVTVAGDLKTSLTLNTVNSVDSTTAPTADTHAFATVNIDNGVALGNLAAITVTGNGFVTIDNSNDAATVGTVGGATKLATIDASALGGTDTLGATKGFVTGGLLFIGNTNVAETVTLGSGADFVDVSGSTVGKLDTITGFDAVQESATAGKSAVDVLVFNGVTFDGATANPGIEKITIDTAVFTTVALAMVHAADVSSTDGTIVQFQFGGNTYLFQDATNNSTLDDTDHAVKLTGVVDLTTDFAIHVA